MPSICQRRIFFQAVDSRSTARASRPAGKTAQTSRPAVSSAEKKGDGFVEVEGKGKGGKKKKRTRMQKLDSSTVLGFTVAKDSGRSNAGDIENIE